MAPSASRSAPHCFLLLSVVEKLSKKHFQLAYECFALVRKLRKVISLFLFIYFIFYVCMFFYLFIYLSFLQLTVSTCLVLGSVEITT